MTSTTFDYETKSSYVVTVEVEDSPGATYQQALTIEILDINDAPTLNAFDDIQVVQDLGQLSIQVDGLSNGGEAGQSITFTTSSSGVVTTASTVASNGNESVTVTFETVNGQQGNGTIEITIKDDGGTANGGVDTFTRVLNVAVLPANITTTDASNCGPGEVTLSASGANDYAWYTNAIGGSAFNTGENLTESVTTNVTYYVAGIFDGNQSALRVPVNAVILDAPATPVINNNNGVLSVTEVSGITYQWLLEGTEIEGASGSSFTPVDGGSYSVRATNENECTATSAGLSVLITSIDSPEEAIVVVLYPNPATEFVNLEFGELMPGGTVIHLVDNNGKQLKRKVLENATNTTKLYVGNVIEGVHLILIHGDGYITRKRLIIKR